MESFDHPGFSRGEPAVQAYKVPAAIESLIGAAGHWFTFSSLREARLE